MGDGRQWPEARANEWYAGQPWLVGCNFIPSTVSNQLEMWQADSFDPETIGRELGWAAALGMNSVRVFLHDLLWDEDAAAFAKRIEGFLDVAASHGISTMFVLFDDCWHPGAALGCQPPPVPGVHNSRWLQSPGIDAIDDDAQWPRLEAYVSGVVSAFAHDERVLAWDIYNEVTNTFLVPQGLPPAERSQALADAARAREARKERNLRLFDLAFEWARAANPAQPVTAGVWFRDRALNERIIAQSDIVTFHNYGDRDAVRAHIGRLRRYNRPLICTEYMARTLGSRFETHLPLFEDERIGCYNWGLVNGKTQTHVAWTAEGAEAPWFHDILHADGTPYDPAEAAIFRDLTG